MEMQLIEFAFMLVIDMMFLVILFLLMLPLGIWRQAAFAVMKRNFIGYFSNPTGYVFLCLFVLLTSFAAFWPHEFFTTNLANFDQLNKFLPYIMLIFIPAITMSIWAEERRQGTDELLLTLPAKDFDIVIGKYFAAVLVFTVSLLFSQLSNYAVLLAMTGGQLDNLLLFSTYLGYWFMGIAMISLGMVASFLTSNLTVGFIIGAALNAPLAFFSNADVIFSNSTWIQRLFEWSLLQRFEPFGRGLINISSIIYFLGLVVIGIYLSMILIGRRHWLGGRDGTSMFWHFGLRAAFVAIIAVASVLIVQYSPLNRARMDISDSKISTLAPDTVEILNKLSKEEGPPIKIEAYVSNNVPSEYVKIKYDLVNLLREFDVLGGKRLDVNLHQGIEPFSEEAILAEKKYGIRPIKVRSQSRGALREEDVVLGVAFSSGLERIVQPFLPYGTPVEYELMRSINTVSKNERKTIGIVQTDSLAWGASITQRDGQSYRIPRLRLLTELQKQYDIEPVDLSKELDLWMKDDNDKPERRRYDALLAIQPSHSTPDELKHLIDAIQSGQPTVIFEDPLPNQQNFEHIRSTFLPRSFARNGPDKAEIGDLWTALEMDVDYGKRQIQIPAGARQDIKPDDRWPYIVWQLASENPYPRNNMLMQKERLIIHDRDPNRDPRFSGVHPATGFREGSDRKAIDELYFQFAGYIKPIPKPSLNFEPLVNTGNAGKILLFDLAQFIPRMFQGPLDSRSEGIMDSKRGSASQQFTIAAHITGDQKDDPIPETTVIKKSKRRTNVIYVADVDTIADFFIQIRDFPIEEGIEYRFQNLSFVLNIIDSLANENTFLALRNRKVDHVTLEKVTEIYEKSMQKVYDEDQRLTIEYETKLSQAQNEIMEKTKPLQDDIRKETRKRDEGKPYDAVKLAAQQGLLEQEIREQSEKFQNKRTQFENERREAKRTIDLEAELEIQKVQRKFKLAAVVIPPIPPLLVGLIVFTRRRLREREGISKARRLK
jgi:ABC-2 type transport system permease protein